VICREVRDVRLAMRSLVGYDPHDTWQVPMPFEGPAEPRPIKVAFTIAIASSAPGPRSWPTTRCCSPRSCRLVPADENGGQPVGVQIVGRRFREDMILDAAEAVERAVGVMAERLWRRGPRRRPAGL
jgi:Asp-tRNA(Asn)/Glu-tRNA(Gln) amidotransferase A subunit family amidase